MKRFSIVLIITFTLFANAFPQEKPPKFIGAYELGCVIACQFIKINSDNTFDYLVDGDLFNEARNKGTWKFISKNRIQVKTPKQKIIVEAKETTVGNADEITVLVLDIYDAIIPNAKIEFLHKNQKMYVVTDENGIAKIPKADQIMISFFGYEQYYSIQDKEITNLLIKITPVLDPTLDQFFEIRNNKLCDIDENGKVDFCHSKFKKKKELKIFQPGF